MKVLFVCTGNSCRSVMAEYILKKKLQDLKISDIEVSSAGTSAADGMSASSNAVALLKEYGIDASKHQARFLTKEIADESDLIFTLARVHRTESLFRYPELRDKIDTLGEKDIADPIGGSKEVYKRAFDEIEVAINKNVLPKIL